LSETPSPPPHPPMLQRGGVYSDFLARMLRGCFFVAAAPARANFFSAAENQEDLGGGTDTVILSQALAGP
jgi:hypothetical protein